MAPNLPVRPARFRDPYVNDDVPLLTDTGDA
jgi:hypothetical protein